MSRAESSANNLRVAITHDWLIGGGAERVVSELHKMFPDAPIYTSYCTDEWRKELDNKVITGYLQKWPFSILRKYVGVLRAHWFSHLDFSGFDLVITSSGNGEAIGIRVGHRSLRNRLLQLFTAQGAGENRKGNVQARTLTANQSPQHNDVNNSSGGVASSASEQTRAVHKPVHVCYCHSPTHYLWRHYDQYTKSPGFRFGTFGLKLLLKPMRKWDYKAAQRPDYFIANSTHIQKDIEKYYGRDSEVIHPPVDVDRFKIQPKTSRSGFVTVGRQVPFKHTEIIVKACSQLGLNLTVVGRGPEHSHLVKIAGPTVVFDDNASDDKVASYMSSAQAFIFASFEDFGVTPVEAMASGTPVIAFKGGGALDYVVEGKTGLFFDEQTSASLTKVLQDFDPTKFDSKTIQRYAQQFSSSSFRANFQNKFKKITGNN